MHSFGKMEVVLWCWNLCIWFQGWCHLCQVFLKLCMHMDFHDTMADKAKHKPLIVFVLALSKGCMLLVWTKYLYMANNQDYFVISTYTFLIWALFFFQVIWVHAGGFTILGWSSGRSIQTSIFTFMSVTEVDLMIKHFRMPLTVKI